MAELPAAVAAFLAGKRFAVTGVSRNAKGHVGNAVFKKLRDAGREVFAVNPNAREVEGVACYADIAAVPGAIDGVVICSHPDTALAIVRQCADKGVKHVWFHRSFGKGSLSDEAVKECEARGMTAISGGCPMMYVAPVDGAHKFVCWWLTLLGTLPR